MSEQEPSASATPAQPDRRRRRRRVGNTTEYRLRNRAVHIPDGYMAVGRIVGAHGLNGELRMELHTDFPERFAPGVELWMGADLALYTVTSAREHKGMILLCVDGVDDRDSAEALRGEWLFIPEDAAMALPEGEYWVHDIIGLAVVDESGAALGRVTDVLQTGANDVYIVAPAENVNRGRELLIPAIAEVVQAVDVPGGLLTIRIVPGLIDE